MPLSDFNPDTGNAIVYVSPDFASVVYTLTAYPETTIDVA
jgi:hypothetical protein